jgi:sugar phosphate isomerase/epimerase
MRPFRIGVMTDSLRLPLGEALRAARALGADGVQAYAVSGEMAPEALDDGGRERLRGLLDELGLAPAALCGDLGGYGFERAEETPEKIARSKRIVDLAADLGAPVVTTHIGVVPAEAEDPVRGTLVAACRELGGYANARGVTFAIETGPEPARVLHDFLREVNSPGVGVNLDPANFVMVTGEDPVRAVEILGPWIVHTHAKDGVRLAHCDAREVYHAFASGGFGALVERMGRLFEEVPLGEGRVPWAAYLDALEAVGFRGFLTIEREVGEDPAGDIGAAVRFLRERCGREEPTGDAT